MKTNQSIRLTTMAAIRTAANQWLHRENRIVSAIMEERVSNQTMLHYLHIGVPAMLALCCMNLVASVALLSWSAGAYRLAKKGGAL